MNIYIHNFMGAQAKNHPPSLPSKIANVDQCWTSFCNLSKSQLSCMEHVMRLGYRTTSHPVKSSYLTKLSKFLKSDMFPIKCHFQTNQATSRQKNNTHPSTCFFRGFPPFSVSNPPKLFPPSKKKHHGAAMLH